MTDKTPWVDKYRPSKVSECILPDSIKKVAQDFVNAGQLPNLLLSGSPGSGKTTLAIALCEELGYSYMMINGSDEGRKIDTLREQVMGYASTVSFSGNRKVVIVDEADYMTDLVQAALRNVIEEFSENCGFIFTCNFKGRMIAAIQSRCACIDFYIESKDKKRLAMEFLKRMCGILDENKVMYDKATVAGLIIKFFPDWRRILNELQRLSMGGKIDAELIALVQNHDVNNIVDMLKSKDFAGIRKWAFTQSSVDLGQLVRDLDNVLWEKAKPQCIPATIIAYADYQHKSVTAVDPAINALAMLTELMANLEFK